MSKGNERGLDYFRSVDDKVREYLGKNKETISSNDYVAAAECYENAAQIIEDEIKGVDGAKFSRESRGRLSTLLNRKEEYIIEAMKLKRKGKNPISRLIRKLGFVVILLLFLFSLFFLQSNFTGLVFLGFDEVVSNSIGFVLLLLGGLCVFLYIKFF